MPLANIAASTVKEMTAVILCGGQGIRMGPETSLRPKPMTMIGEYPIVWHIMKNYALFGTQRFVLCLGYLGDVIRDYFLHYTQRHGDHMVSLRDGIIKRISPPPREDWYVILAETGEMTQTGGRLRQAIRHIDDTTFFATYGDGVADIDLTALLARHQESGKLATVTAVRPSSRFGELALDGAEVISFREKPQLDQGWINGGFMVFERRVFDSMQIGDECALESGLLEQLASIGELAVYRHDGFWQCMDTPREMRLLNELWHTGKPPWFHIAG